MSPDWNTATSSLTEGLGNGDNYGQVQLTWQMTVDFRPDVPIVTDVKLVQHLSA